MIARKLLFDDTDKRIGASLPGLDGCNVEVLRVVSGGHFTPGQSIHKVISGFQSSPTSKDISDRSRTRDQRVTADLRGDSLSIVPPAPWGREGEDRQRGGQRVKEKERDRKRERVREGQKEGGGDRGLGKGRHKKKYRGDRKEREGEKMQE
ncbi:hypothetical protein PoB_000612300 [Plakobranchus ocellatus]|uniref:Uncharacterized protein n=1 Tax=Plakobranchus ocellatus TaxID=259542 RepID=A0AAV3YAZ5_9GAST|nr:hypothetical protein PoB_000612300 [Plakobranchus ocellatus]